MPKRRAFLFLSVGTIVLAGIPVSLKFLRDGSGALDSQEKNLFALIAADYFKLVPEEKNPETLKKFIPHEAELSELISAEFRRGEFVTLSGWNLSKTEARLISYLALRERLFE